MAMLRDDRINYLNIGLMGITAILAYFMPFETFLFAYAFLGPLHYLTEISWLHDRQYFSKGKYDFIVLLVIGVLLSLVAFAKDFGYEIELYKQFVELNLFDKLLVFALFSAILFALVKNVLIKVVSCLLLFVFVAGWLDRDNVSNYHSNSVFALTSLVPTLIHVYLFTGLFMLYGALKSRSRSGLLQMVGFVVIPVSLVFWVPVDIDSSTPSKYAKEAYYADGDGFHYTNYSILSRINGYFTNEDYVKYIYRDQLSKSKEINYQFALDCLYPNHLINGKKGIQRNDSVYYSAGVDYEKINWKNDNAVDLPKKTYLDSIFTKNKEKFITQEIQNFYQSYPKDEEFLIPDESSPFYLEPVYTDLIISSSHPAIFDWIYYSQIGIMLMRFIAFAYLYHYLNWFSKTEIIQWHKVPKVRFIAVIILWLAACGFYIYDYGLGLNVLFFLSFTHVLLEFPLNIVSIVGIGKESLAIFKHGFKPLKTDS